MEKSKNEFVKNKGKTSNELKTIRADYQTGENSDRNLEDAKLCTCYNVSENEVRRVIAENSLTTVEEVTNFTKAGGGCGRCKPKIQAILDEINGGTK